MLQVGTEHTATAPHRQTRRPRTSTRFVRTEHSGYRESEPETQGQPPTQAGGEGAAGGAPVCGQAQSCPLCVGKLSHAHSCAPCMVAHQAPLSVGFSRQERWRGLPCPPPRDLPDPGIKLGSSALAGEFFTTEPPGKPGIPQAESKLQPDAGFPPLYKTNVWVASTEGNFFFFKGHFFLHPQTSKTVHLRCLGKSGRGGCWRRHRDEHR